MKKSNVVKELLYYSNVIIAFVVLQDLTFLYTFSKRAGFYCILRDREAVAIAILILFVIILVGTIIANSYLCQEIIKRVGKDDIKLFKNIFWGKYIIITLFQALVIFVCVSYTILDTKKDNSICEQKENPKCCER